MSNFGPNEQRIYGRHAKARHQSQPPRSGDIKTNYGKGRDAPVNQGHRSSTDGAQKAAQGDISNRLKEYGIQKTYGPAHLESYVPIVQKPILQFHENVPQQTLGRNIPKQSLPRSEHPFVLPQGKRHVQTPWSKSPDVPVFQGPARLPKENERRPKADIQPSFYPLGKDGQQFGKRAQEDVQQLPFSKLNAGSKASEFAMQNPHPQNNEPGINCGVRGLVQLGQGNQNMAPMQNVSANQTPPAHNCQVVHNKGDSVAVYKEINPIVQVVSTSDSDSDVPSVKQSEKHRKRPPVNKRQKQAKKGGISKASRKGKRPSAGRKGAQKKPVADFFGGVRH